MQRIELLAGLLASLLCVSFTARAQDAATAALREEQEANYKRVILKLEGIEETLQLQAKRTAALASEISTLRDEVDRLKSRNESAATQESIKRLAEKIEEVDRKRLADSEMVAKRIGALGKEMSKTLVPRDPPPAPAPKPQKSTEPEKGFTYQIKEGDTLVRIVTDLRAQDYKITQKQVMDANPSVNWNRLRIGQTVMIPAPSP